MRWRKLGMVYKPDGSSWWARTHATAPTPLAVSSDLIRVYLTCRDERGIGRVGFIDVSAQDPTRVVEVGREPILDVGRPGCFDDNGVMVTCVLSAPDGRIFLYYVGFEISIHIRYRLMAGLAISRDGQQFNRAQETPVLERSPDELYFRGGAHVRYEDNRYRMWYCAGSEWINLAGKEMPVYDLRYIESSDGMNWPSRGEVVVPISGEDEHGFGRPWVLRRDEGWELFYSVRRNSLRAYRMGCAVSADGIHWRRCDDAMGMDVSASDWESEAVCYAAPVTVAGRTWLFYNGNGFGETGLGLALRED